MFFDCFSCCCLIIRTSLLHPGIILQFILRERFNSCVIHYCISAVSEFSKSMVCLYEYREWIFSFLSLGIVFFSFLSLSIVCFSRFLTFVFQPVPCLSEFITLSHLILALTPLALFWVDSSQQKGGGRCSGRRNQRQQQL